MGKIRDWTQTKVGHLQPLYIDETKPRGAGHNIYWICQCDCGGQVSVNSANLRSGERLGRKMHCPNCTLREDLTGKKFGKLTVKGLDTQYENSKPGKERGWHHKWICECECGNIISVFGANLRKNHTLSCGCINRSIGEQNIELLLKENNINYKKEYSFEDLKNKKKLRFDFAIFDNDNNLIKLIEFDGRQHVNDYNPWGKSQESLKDRQKRDNIKNNYCKNNNIKLLRIPYWKRDYLTIEEILPELIKKEKQND